MADVKISQLTALASANVVTSSDVLPIVDASVPQTKKITVENLLSPITIDKSAGTITSLGTVTGSFQANGGAVFNEGSADVDFRVESNDSANMLFVDGGNNKVLIEANNTDSVTDAATMIAASALEVNGNAGEGSDILRIGAMADATGGYFLEASNGAGSASYNLLLNPINGGNVGIGSSTIQTVGGGTTLSITGDAPEITLVDNATNTPYAWIATNDYGSLILAADRAGEAGGSYIRMDIDGTERMRIDSAGKVGIHTNNPNVSSANAERGVLTISSTDNAGANNYAILELQGHSFNDQGALGVVSFLDHSTNCASIQVNTEDNSQNSGRMTFATRPAGGTITERMRIGSSGKIGIGTTNTNSLINIPTVVYTDSAGPDQGIRVHNPDSSHSADAVFQPIEVADYVDWYWGSNTYFATNASKARFDSTKGTASILLSGANNKIFMYTGGASESPQERFAINENGYITQPSQPAFLAKPNSVQQNPGNNMKIDFDTEVFDQGGNFSNDTFTAPVSGRYQLQVWIRCTGGLDTATEYQGFQLQTSNRTYSWIIDPDMFDSSGAHFTVNFSVLADMDANDTAVINHFYYAGTVSLDIDTDSFFSGYLVA